jgi:prevent-host-death family protein
MVTQDRIDLTEDLLPASTLQASVSQVLHEVEADSRRKVITREGQPVAVLMSVGEYERLRSDAATTRLLREIRQGEAEIEAGLGIPHEEVERRFRKRWGISVAGEAAPVPEPQSP